MSDDDFGDIDPFAALDLIQEKEVPKTKNQTKQEHNRKIDSNITQTKQEGPDITQTKQSKKFIHNFLIDLALSSEFERIIFKTVIGKVIRGSNETIEFSLSNILKCFHDYFSQYSQKELSDPGTMDLIIKELNQKLIFIRINNKKNNTR